MIEYAIIAYGKIGLNNQKITYDKIVNNSL
jgi:hypothetical protein